MESDQLLRVADHLVHARTGKYLTDLQKNILRGTLRGDRYQDMGDCAKMTAGHLKNEGAHLWRSLSDALGEKVSKTNFRESLERQARCDYRRLGE